GRRRSRRTKRMVWIPPEPPRGERLGGVYEEECSLLCYTWCTVRILSGIGLRNELRLDFPEVISSIACAQTVLKIALSSASSNTRVHTPLDLEKLLSVLLLLGYVVYTIFLQ